MPGARAAGSSSPGSDTLRWYAFDDRGIYRPGEAVHVKGWIRRVGSGSGGDVGPLDGAAEQVNYRLRDAQGNQILDGTAELTALGGFTMVFTLTETMNLGYTALELEALGGGNVEGRQYTHSIQVQEFRRPEFEVKASSDEGPHFVGGGADVQVAANYYAGGGLPNAETTWQVTSRPGQYSPPGWDDFIFGTWVPWWRSGLVMASASARTGKPFGPFPSDEGAKVETYTGRTDAAGVHRLRLDFQSVNPPEPMAVTAEATVMDVNRQAWTASANLLVHPADLYVGLRSDRVFVQREEPLKIDVIVTDLDGNPAPGKEVKLIAARLGWKVLDGTWQEIEVAAQPCTVESAREPVRCTFETPDGGTYRITATVVDDRGRPNRTEITRWVTGGERPPARTVEQEEVTLIPDKKDYQPGDTAEILVQAPFYPAEGMVTLRRSGIVQSERFTMDELDLHAQGADHRRLHPQHPCPGGPGGRGPAHRRCRIGARRHAHGQPDRSAPAARLRHRRAQPRRAAPGAHAGAGRHAARPQAGARRQDDRGRARARRRGPARARGRAGGRRGGRGGAGADQLRPGRPARGLLRRARRRCRRPPLAGRHRAGQSRPADAGGPERRPR